MPNLPAGTVSHVPLHVTAVCFRWRSPWYAGVIWRICTFDAKWSSFARKARAQMPGTIPHLAYPLAYRDRATRATVFTAHGPRALTRLAAQAPEARGL